MGTEGRKATRGRDSPADSSRWIISVLTGQHCVFCILLRCVWFIHLWDVQPLVLGAAAAAAAVTWRETLEGLPAAQRSTAVGSVLMILQQDTNVRWLSAPSKLTVDVGLKPTDKTVIFLLLSHSYSVSVDDWRWVIDSPSQKACCSRKHGAQLSVQSMGFVSKMIWIRQTMRCREEPASAGTVCHVLLTASCFDTRCELIILDECEAQLCAAMKGRQFLLNISNNYYPTKAANPFFIKHFLWNGHVAPKLLKNGWLRRTNRDLLNFSASAGEVNNSKCQWQR